MRLIDADDLHVDYLFPSTTTMTKCYEYVSKEQINNAPTIEAVPVVHGWLVNPIPYGECSECGTLLDIRQGFKYCPMCGARLEGVKMEEEKDDPEEN